VEEERCLEWSRPARWCFNATRGLMHFSRFAVFDSAFFKSPFPNNSQEHRDSTPPCVTPCTGNSAWFRITAFPLYNIDDLRVPSRPSKSYLTPPRWRGLGNGSTPVSHHITTRLQRVDENVDPAKLGGCARLSLTWGLGCPVGVGWVGPGLGSALLVSWSVHWVSI